MSGQRTGHCIPNQTLSLLLGSSSLRGHEFECLLTTAMREQGEILNCRDTIVGILAGQHLEVGQEPHRGYPGDSQLD